MADGGFSSEMISSCSGINYEEEERKFRQSLSSNENKLRNISLSYETSAKETFKKLRNRCLETIEERKKVKERLEEIRHNIDLCNQGYSHNRQEIQELQQELERQKCELEAKEEELRVHKEQLLELEEKMKGEEAATSETQQKNQDKISRAQRSIELYKTNLGLNITLLRDNTFKFTFTQISRDNPDKEYKIKIRLDGDTYHILESEPPLPSLQRLQEELNETGDLKTCTVRIRRMFQQMDK